MNELLARLKALARHKAATAVAIALAASLLAVYAVGNLSFLTSAERFVEDWQIAFRSPPEPQDPGILILAVDESTMQHFPYRSPLDRGFLAGLMTSLDAKHPRAIVLDYLFDQPTEKDKDDALRAALHAMQTPTVVSYFEAGSTVAADQTAYLNAFVPANMRALANIGTDQTDTVRWILPGGPAAGGQTLLSVPRKVAALVGVKTADARVPIVWRADAGDNQPAFSQITACVPIAGHCLPITSILPEATFKDKIVLIGSDLNLVDHHRTPYATDSTSPKATMPGIVIMANAISQLLHHRDPPQLTWWSNFLIVLAFAALGAGLGLLEFSLWLRAGAVAMLIAALWALGVFVLYPHVHVLIGLIAPSLAVAGSFAAVDSIAGLEARQQREFIHNTFSLYLPPSFVQQLVDDPSKLVLGGERRDMSLLFTDIAGFTTMAEKLDSKDVGRVLNDYLDGMTGAVKKHDGTVDKFIGDAVFALWNAPVEVADYATKAVRCALDMDAFTEAFRRKMNAEGIPLGITRIGVHAGAAAVGNFGSRDRFSYTASGDAVNAASRLEGLNKTFGTRLCVSDAAKVLCQGIKFRPIGSVVLKGKTEALDVWEPLHDGAVSEDLLARYQAAFEAVRDHDDSAAQKFAGLAADAPDDPLVQFWIERLAQGETGIKIKMTEK
ncbi:MAG TPA: adenylate/guanylate cyclase domain-containing protein [Rhizomicrobium sp.]|jgi:adenylate cyclase|nr:adenylate/guanylate cyclase domain-containing protein [Rhizomicrobium sp.]